MENLRDDVNYGTFLMIFDLGRINFNSYMKIFLTLNEHSSVLVIQKKTGGLVNRVFTLGSVQKSADTFAEALCHLVKWRKLGNFVPGQQRIS